MTPEQRAKANERSRLWYHRNRGKERQRSRRKTDQLRLNGYATAWYYKHKDTANGRAKILLQSAKRRAAKRKLDVTISVEFVEKRILAGVCEATGLPFVLEKSGSRSPSLDRINPKRGYTPANTQVVCLQYNLAKSEWPHSTLVEMARALMGKRKRRKPTIN